MPISSSRRQRVIEFTTPKISDLVVVERVDCSRNVSSADVADNTDYGTAHPDTDKFAGFKLALIKNSDNDQGQFQDWYYVKDRSDQDKYNWEFQAAGANNPRFDTVVSTYVTLRSAFDEYSPAIGNSNGMPLPSDHATTDPFTKTTTSGDNYDNNYVLFEKKQVRSGDETLDSLYVIEQHIYVKRVSIVSVDTDTQFPYNDYNETGNAFGGLISKETLFHKDEDVKATTEFFDDDDSDEGVTNTLRDVNTGAGDDNRKEAEYVFTDKQAYYSISSAKYNFWGVDQAGVMREGKQLSENWYVLAERQIIRKDTNGLVASYFTNQNMSWPTVFSHMFVSVWNRRDGGKHTNIYPTYLREAYSGPTKTEVKIFWKKTPFAMGTSTDHSDTALTQLKPMEPMVMEFVTPNWRVKTKPCLHGDVTMTYTNGTEDPVWDYGGYKTTWKATNYTGWPDDIVISDTQEPFRGGYLRTKVTAYKPDISTSSDANNGRHAIPTGFTVQTPQISSNDG